MSRSNFDHSLEQNDLSGHSVGVISYYPPTPPFLRITDVIPTETHCVPHNNRYPYNSLSWWFFRKFSIFLKWPSMYSLKWRYLYRLSVRQTYQRKCFRFLLWECGSFLSQGITKCAYARALYMMYAPLLGLILHTCPSVEYISSLFGIGPSTTVIE